MHALMSPRTTENSLKIKMVTKARTLMVKMIMVIRMMTMKTIILPMRTYTIRTLKIRITGMLLMIKTIMIMTRRMGIR